MSDVLTAVPTLGISNLLVPSIPFLEYVHSQAKVKAFVTFTIVVSIKIT